MEPEQFNVKEFREYRFEMLIQPRTYRFNIEAKSEKEARVFLATDLAVIMNGLNKIMDQENKK